jgi:hypothetical protein
MLFSMRKLLLLLLLQILQRRFLSAAFLQFQFWRIFLLGVNPEPSRPKLECHSLLLSYKVTKLTPKKKKEKETH